MILYRRTRLERLVPLLLLAVAACGDNSSGQTPPARQQVTALLVVSTNEPLRVLGSDGREHLEYDLVMTNVFTDPVTLTSIDVLDAAGAVLLHSEGDGLAAQTRPVFVGPLPTLEVPLAGAVATIMDVIVPAGEIPQRLTHRISYTVPDTFAAALLTSRTIDGPDLVVDRRLPTVLAPPLRGPGWLNSNGCCAEPVAHRSVRLIADGTQWRKIEMFAIDWVVLRDGRLFEGDGTRNEQWFGYGQEVVAAASGTVTAMRDGVPNQTPKQAPVGIHTPEDFAGNYVIVQISGDVWAAYAHLVPGSVAVRVGDRVAVGQHLGLVGNTGTTTAPHLHFQLCDGPDIIPSTSLPFVFGDYTLSGTIDGAQFFAALADPDAPPIVVNGTAQAQSETHPLLYTVADFGS